MEKRNLGGEASPDKPHLDTLGRAPEPTFQDLVRSQPAKAKDLATWVGPVSPL